MVDAQWTAIRTTPNSSPRHNVPRKGVVLHHAAMTSLSGLRSLAMGRKQVSATAIVKDGEAENLVRDEDRPWSLADAWGDSSFRSVETANESTDGWTISDASHWTLARLVAHWAEKDGFYPHRNGDPRTWTVIGHREYHTIYGGSYATACPGGMNLDLVVARAQSLLGSSTASGTTKPVLEPQGETMFPIRVAGRDVYYISPGRLFYETNPAGATLVKNITTTDDKFHDIKASDFVAVLDAFGVPRDQPERLRKGPVREWSRGRDAYDQLQRLLKKLAA